MEQNYPRRTENGDYEEAENYLEEYKTSVENLEEKFETVFCSFQKRFEPIVDLIGKVVPSYNDTEIQQSVDKLRQSSRNFLKDNFKNIFLKDYFESQFLQSQF